MGSTGGAVVASGHPLAAQAGCAAFRADGSAVDAALAMAFCQWVVNAPLCGPGGDMVLMHARGDEVTVYGGWARVPSAFPVGSDIPYHGPGAAVVPGACLGAYAAWQGAGRLPWADLFADALDAATGHRVTPWMQKAFASVQARGNGAALAAVLDQPGLPAADDVISMRRLATSLSMIADGGPSVLHGGRLGEALLAASRVDGAYLGAEDLLGQAEVVPAKTADVDGLHIAYPGEPSQAAIAAELLDAVDRDVPVEDRRFAATLAQVTEAALVRRCVVGLSGTAVSVAATGDEAAVVVHSLAGVQFGSGWVAGDTGIALGNRVGTALSNRSDLPAANPRPGEVVPHTLSAAWLRSGQRSLMIATPGGDRQVQWLAQAAQRFRQDAAIADLVGGPRWFVCPEGDRFGVPQGIGAQWFLFAEPGISWRGDTTFAGYTVRPVETVGGGLQAAARLGDGPWTSASDWRAAGAALAAEQH